MQVLLSHVSDVCDFVNLFLQLCRLIIFRFVVIDLLSRQFEIDLLQYEYFGGEVVSFLLHSLDLTYKYVALFLQLPEYVFFVCHSLAQNAV